MKCMGDHSKRTWVQLVSSPSTESFQARLIQRSQKVRDVTPGTRNPDIENYIGVIWGQWKRKWRLLEYYRD